MSDSILYKVRSGKPIKFWYFIRKYMGLVIPDSWYRIRLEQRLCLVSSRPDYPYIQERVNYYIRLDRTRPIPSENRLAHHQSWLHYTGPIGQYRSNMFHKAYYFDQHDITRWFPPSLRWNYCPGDVYFTPDDPAIVKSRLISSQNQNSVLLKLDKLRHFMYVKDTKSFTEKQDRAIFRGKIRQSRLRTKFLEKFFGHPMFDCGVVGKNEGCPDEWMAPKRTIHQHLDYKFIMALEGNDVASNLKWVMSSNSIAVMPRPTCETWFMEGKLRPDYHYIEVKEDFSDLEEKLNYYIAHPEEAQQIITHAHEFVAQFRNPEREELISLLVLKRYFELTGQWEPSTHP